MEIQKYSQVMLIVAATAVLPVLAAEKMNTDVSTITQKRGGPHSETANFIRVNSERVMINRLRKVEVLLDTKEVARARGVLTSSREFSRELQDMKMRTELAYRHIISINKTKYPDGIRFAFDRVGVYSGLDEMEVYAPKVAEKMRGGFKLAQNYAMSGDIRQAIETLKEIAFGVPSSLLPGQDIDQQILLALALLGENQPDISTARNVVKKVLDKLTPE